MAEKFYITTSIAYTNAPPHIGFALELIQADVLARYQRLRGKEVFFLTGTDEHGQKVVEAAEKEKKSSECFAGEISEKYKELKDLLGLSNDDFIRTSDNQKHWPAVEKVWLKLKENGDIYKKKYKGLYCPGCEAFVVRRDLIRGKCAVHKVKPEEVEEENYFFRLSRYSKEIEKIIEEDRIKIIPRSRKKEMMNFLKKGLEDISFSRSSKKLKWGIPVPGDESQTIYVWADALVNYISAIGYAQNSKDFQKYWPADVHCIGKDIQKFHCLIWPAMLLALGLDLPKAIFIHGFITVAGQKMSKSLGNIVDPFELVKKYGKDPVRYFLLREIPSSEDGDFTCEKFEGRYNSDLARGLGNLTFRILTLASGKELKEEKISEKVSKAIAESKKDCQEKTERFEFNESLASIWKLISFSDKYIEDSRPWEESEEQKKIIYELLAALSHIALMIQPFLPDTSAGIFEQLGVYPSDREWKFKIKKGKPLFPGIG
jgi:methionyl-tRNA synthetase